MNQHQWRRFPLAVAKILHPHEGTTISCDIFFYVKCCKKKSLQIFFFTHLHDMGSRINVALVKKGWYITGFMKQNNSEVFPSTKKKWMKSKLEVPNCSPEDCVLGCSGNRGGKRGDKSEPEQNETEQWLKNCRALWTIWFVSGSEFVIFYFFLTPFLLQFPFYYFLWS